MYGYGEESEKCDLKRDQVLHMEGEEKRGTTLRKISSSIFIILFAISSTGAWTKMWICWAYRFRIWFRNMQDDVKNKSYALRLWEHVNLSFLYHFILYFKEYKLLVTRIFIDNWLQLGDNDPLRIAKNSRSKLTAFHWDMDSSSK